MTYPEITVVVLHFEQPEKLTRLLPILAEQRDHVSEVLIVDDGSLRHPVNPEIVEKGLPSARLLVQKVNTGTVAAMNRGLAKATGPFVHFLACDDVVLPGFYDTARQALADCPDAGLFCSGTAIADEHGRTIGSHRLPRPSATPTCMSAGTAMAALHEGGSWFAGNTAVFSRSGLLDVGGFDPDLEEFSDAFACYVLAAKKGLSFDPRDLAVKHDPLSGRNMSIYTDAEKSARLRTHAMERMAGNFADLFPPAFVRRFCRRWLLNERTIRLYRTNAKLAGATPLSAVEKAVFARHYLEYRLRDRWDRIRNANPELQA